MLRTVIEKIRQNKRPLWKIYFSIEDLSRCNRTMLCKAINEAKFIYNIINALHKHRLSIILLSYKLIVEYTTMLRVAQREFEIARDL